ncbi:MAG: protein jag [Lachnospiraceae bacterium]|nr:protein jag [Lachnospiraceae bacterium]
MGEYKEYTGKTVDEAITNACSSLLVTSDELDYIVIRQPAQGFLGIGSKDALIKARKGENSGSDMDDSGLDIEESAVDAEDQDVEVKVTVSEVEGKSFDDSVVSEDADAGSADDLSVVNGASANDESEDHYIPASEADIPVEPGENFLKAVLNDMNINADVKTTYNPTDGTVSFEIVGKGMGILIGKRGKTLDALQYLLSLVMNKDSDHYIRVKLDTEDYRNRRKETLETLARNMASKARKSRRSVELEPMNAYERRIIHYSLQGNRYVTTHSEGEEPYRHIVIVPVQATGSNRHYN